MFVMVLATFLLMGASNVSGNADPARLPLQPGAENVHAYNVGAGIWINPAKEPIHLAKPGHGGGPGALFALNYIALGKASSVTLYACAKGGSKMADWAPGGWLYNRCIAAVGDRQVDGVIFGAGGADATAASNANQWQSRFESMVSDLRTRYGVALPVLMLRLGPKPPSGGAYWGTVRKAQAAVSIHGVLKIETEGKRMAEDKRHLSVYGYRQFAAEAAELMP